MKSKAPDSIKMESSFKINFFKTIIIKFFSKTNKNIYKLLPIKEVAQLFTSGGSERRSENRRRENDSLNLAKTTYTH
jgi:hypothetical protein